MIETEVLSQLSKKLFDKKLNKFAKLFGKPLIQKRASVSLSSYETKVDTRIKITNGKVHIVQKTGGELSQFLVRKEIDIDLNVSLDDLVSVIRMLQNIGKHLEGFTSHLQQFENSLFKIPDGEIKMYYQFGKSDFYGFELEVNEGVDIHAKLNDLGLKVDDIERSNKYWRDYDERINLNCFEMSDKELKEILKKYL